jgi:MFS transporter, NNP family, nitrate/nitrite transporter
MNGMAAVRVLARKRRWVDRWEPENPDFWEATGRKIANRNLWFSMFAEHIGFSVWSLWSVMVLFMGETYHITAADKFLLVSTATFVGAVVRIPYTFAPARFGGRNWTVASAVLLLIPTGAAAVVMHPGTSLTTFMIIAAIAGFGGGNFASSMTNINAFFPERYKGRALGVNAAGGNIGVAAIQLVGLLVLATAGATDPRLVMWVYLPLIVLAVLGAAFFMDNLSTVRNDTRSMRQALREAHTWVLSFLYLGTFGSFIGYSFAFGLVLQIQFAYSPLAAARLTFLGPLLGSLSRPLGGWLADRFGGARITFAVFILMMACAVMPIAASYQTSLPLFLVGFTGLFVFSGIGNGSTYKMIPAIFRAKYLVTAGSSEGAALLRARRISGAVIGLVSAIGALGGLFINLAFRLSFGQVSNGVPAFISFIVLYAGCSALTWQTYLRRSRTTTTYTPSGTKV